MALLPYLGQGALYRQFKLDEAWDSPHNIKLLDRMPRIYAAARRESAGSVSDLLSGVRGP